MLERGQFSIQYLLVFVAVTGAWLALFAFDSEIAFLFLGCGYLIGFARCYPVQNRVSRNLFGPPRFSIRGLLVGVAFVAAMLAFLFLGSVLAGLGLICAFLLVPAYWLGLRYFWFWMPLAISLAWQVQRLFMFDSVDHVLEIIDLWEDRPDLGIDVTLGLICLLNVVVFSALTCRSLSSQRQMIIVGRIILRIVTISACVAFMIMTPNWLMSFLYYYVIGGSPIGIPYPFPMTGWPIGIVLGAIIASCLIASRSIFQRPKWPRIDGHTTCLS